MGIQNPRKLGEEPPKKSLVGNLLAKMKHYCKKDPKIQLGPNVSVRGIPALEVMNLPNNIGYCIQIEKKHVTLGSAKSHVKSPHAQATVHQTEGQLHPETDKTFFWTMAVIGVVLFILLLVSVIIVCAVHNGKISRKQEQKAEHEDGASEHSKDTETKKVSRAKSCTSLLPDEWRRPRRSRSKRMLDQSLSSPSPLSASASGSHRNSKSPATLAVCNIGSSRSSWSSYRSSSGSPRQANLEPNRTRAGTIDLEAGTSRSRSGSRRSRSVSGRSRSNSRRSRSTSRRSHRSRRSRGPSLAMPSRRRSRSGRSTRACSRRSSRGPVLEIVVDSMRSSANISSRRSSRRSRRSTRKAVSPARIRGASDAPVQDTGNAPGFTRALEVAKFSRSRALSRFEDETRC